MRWNWVENIWQKKETNVISSILITTKSAPWKIFLSTSFYSSLHFKGRHKAMSGKWFSIFFSFVSFSSTMFSFHFNFYTCFIFWGLDTWNIDVISLEFIYFWSSHSKTCFGWIGKESFTFKHLFNLGIGKLLKVFYSANFE